MALAPGTRLGVYEIVSAIGQGGMGEVYRAVDTRLKRQVAIKTLPSGLAADPDRLARFQREAEVLASLNHPNIAGIYGLEESQGGAGSGTHALVMELIEGPDLSERIRSGPIPQEEALPIARQIVDALEAAHALNIIHRDLKPANIKIRSDGTVKVLDFGLAKALEPAGAIPAKASMSMSPTITTPAMTQMGMVLGTAAYMAPEQAKGRAVDRRADIWAFGIVLYEMLTGRRAFEGDDVADTLANVLKTEPDWTRLPETLPARTRQVIRACLQKDPRQRIGDMQDLRLALDGAFDAGPSGAPAPVALPSRRREYMWAAAAFGLLVATGLLAVRALSDEPLSRGATVRFNIPIPLGTTPNGPSVISPDGSRLAFAATAESKTLLWVLALNATTPQSLAGTDGATRPFWSADSQWIGFFAQGKLKRIAAVGGQVQNICNLASTASYNGTWSRDGVILFAPNDQGPILRVPAEGGQPTPVTQLDVSLKETRHSYPNFLPDGRHFSFWVQAPSRAGIVIGALDSNERHPLPEVVSEAKYSPTGHLLHLQNSALMAQPFDLTTLKLSGDAIQVVDQVIGGPFGTFSVSDHGDIAYSELPDSSIIWFDRSGRELSTVGAVGEYNSPMLSPDGRFAAFERGSPANIWVMDLQRAVPTPFVSNVGADLAPVWSPDGKAMLYVSQREGQRKLYQHPFGTAGEETAVLKTDDPVNTPLDWASGSRDVVFATALDLWTVPGADSSRAVHLTNAPSAELQARFSADGRWIAYSSNESGRFEIYVQSYPKPQVRKLVSTAGGGMPRWRRDGRELYFVDPSGMLMAAPIKAGEASLDIDAPVPLFRTRLRMTVAVDMRQRGQYDVAPDGNFLMAVAADAAPRVGMILNWRPGQAP